VRRNSTIQAAEHKMAQQKKFLEEENKRVEGYQAKFRASLKSEQQEKERLWASNLLLQLAELKNRA
jgi:hypothetical protein